MENTEEIDGIKSDDLVKLYRAIGDYIDLQGESEISEENTQN